MRLQRFLRIDDWGISLQESCTVKNIFMPYVAANLLTLRGLAGFDAVP